MTFRNALLLLGAWSAIVLLGCTPPPEGIILGDPSSMPMRGRSSSSSSMPLRTFDAKTRGLLFATFRSRREPRPDFPSVERVVRYTDIMQLTNAEDVRRIATLENAKSTSINYQTGRMYFITKDNELGIDDLAAGSTEVVTLPEQQKPFRLHDILVRGKKVYYLAGPCEWEKENAVCGLSAYDLATKESRKILEAGTLPVKFGGLGFSRVQPSNGQIYLDSLFIDAGAGHGVQYSVDPGTGTVRSRAEEMHQSCDGCTQEMQKKNERFERTFMRQAFSQCGPWTITGRGWDAFVASKDGNDVINGDQVIGCLE